MNEGTLNIEAALANVASQITCFEERYGRKTGSVQLLAVSKRKPVSAIRSALAAGQKAFGENYVDEGVEKILEINDPSLTWHFIGAIQSRKTSLIAEHFDWAHGVDRLKVARRLSEQRPTHLPALNICLQVNLDNEPSKAGIALPEVAELAAQCALLEGIRVRGLMAIPAPRELLAEQRKVLSHLRTALQTLQANHPDIDTLSMGMSADMEAAIAEGATIVRVGTAIFGARDS
ncbi:MAG: YggS family pyridoxal phosphate-dependent enzyme [Granulosicoccus sp.]